MLFLQNLLTPVFVHNPHDTSLSKDELLEGILVSSLAIQLYLESGLLSNPRSLAPFIDVYASTLEHKDEDINGVLWSEESKDHPRTLLDYFFLTEGANNEFVSLDYIYPEEFLGLPKASDHIPIILDLASE